MNEMIKTPEFLFESSWEVCNKVGGIYVVHYRLKLIRFSKFLTTKVIFISRM